MRVRQPVLGLTPLCGCVPRGFEPAGGCHTVKVSGVFFLSALCLAATEVLASTCSHSPPQAGPWLMPFRRKAESLYKFGWAVFPALDLCRLRCPSFPLLLPFCPLPPIPLASQELIPNKWPLDALAYRNKGPSCWVSKAGEAGGWGVPCEWVRVSHLGKPFERQLWWILYEPQGVRQGIL